MNKIFVVATYATVNGSKDEKTEFWKDLDSVLDVCDVNEKLIMAGDFNGWVREMWFRKSLG
jgi:hypothetical protein